MYALKVTGYTRSYRSSEEMSLEVMGYQVIQGYATCQSLTVYVAGSGIIQHKCIQLDSYTPQCVIPIILLDK